MTINITVTKYPRLANLAFYTVSVNLSYSYLPKPQLELGNEIMGEKISSYGVLYKKWGKLHYCNKEKPNHSSYIFPKYLFEIHFTKRKSRFL